MVSLEQGAASKKRIVFLDIQMYLDAIAANADRDIENSGHKSFWRMTYKDFVNGVVPNEKCNGAPIPIVDKDPKKCPFYQSLVNSDGWCKLGKMPKGGPFIGDKGFTVKLTNGQTISGADIGANIVSWLKDGMPEK